MATPDFAEARRRLRQARIREALNDNVDATQISRYRNRLLQVLGPEAVTSEGEFDYLSEDKVDTVVSIALSAVDESAEDATGVMLMCLRVLAADGQFARIALLSNRLTTLGGQFSNERPFWSEAIISLALALRGKQDRALLNLEERLGLGTDLPRGGRKPRDSRQVNDVLAAAVLRSLLREHSSIDFAISVRSLALQTGDGELLAYVEAARSWHDSVSIARPSVVVPEADPTFQSALLARYLDLIPIPALFPAQIRALRTGATHDNTRVVALPTSSGKTLIAELRIVAALTRHPGSKAIYVAPYRLLARQVEISLRQRLPRLLQFKVHDLGSGYDPTAMLPGESADVIICTPERLDSLLRLSNSDATGHSEARALFDSCSVLVFDEMHLVGRSGRGPRFEFILARLRYLWPDLGILGLAAATHGSVELSEWLNDDSRIDASQRPTGTLELLWETNGTIRQRVSRTAGTSVAVIPRKTPLDDAASLILRLGPRHTPALAVCTNRRNAENLAKKILAANPARGDEWREGLSPAQLITLGEAVEEIKSILSADHPLGKLMNSGISFHHAGVPAHALELIERLTREGLMRAVAATTTVAEGADLPFKVVVIPHLNFPGSSRKLERDLYLNIIGRAGRANVAVEGMVFVLDSDARTISDHVRGSLWSTSGRDQLRGQLGKVTAQPRTLEDWNAFLEVQSQVIGWLGDGHSYVEGQAEALGSLTFSYSEGNRIEKAQISRLIEDALADLQVNGLAKAASPFRLTERGQRARLSGLSVPSARRLEAATERGRDGWLDSAVDVVEITEGFAMQVARLVHESFEVFQNSLWFRRHAKNDAAKFQEMSRFCVDGSQSHQDHDDFSADLLLLARWMMGDSYLEISTLAPPAKTASGMFGGNDESKLVSDACEFIGKLTYPAGWAWSAAQILGGVGPVKSDGHEDFVRGAIQYGLPSESAVYLAGAGVTREGAMTVAREAGPTRNELFDWISSDRSMVDLDGYLTRLDSTRLVNIREDLDSV